MKRLALAAIVLSIVACSSQEETPAVDTGLRNTPAPTVRTVAISRIVLPTAPTMPPTNIRRASSICAGSKTSAAPGAASSPPSTSWKKTAPTPRTSTSSSTTCWVTWRGNPASCFEISIRCDHGGACLRAAYSGRRPARHSDNSVHVALPRGGGITGNGAVVDGEVAHIPLRRGPGGSLRPARGRSACRRRSPPAGRSFRRRES